MTQDMTHRTFTAPPPAPTIAQVITQMQGEIARALPKHMDADRMARLALTVVRRTPKLAECTPASFAGALLTAAALGLEPGVNDECYLVPYKDQKRGIVECQLIVGYKGYAKLFYQHPMARSLRAEAVHEHDDFEYELGTHSHLRHRPARGDRGAIVDYYAVASLSNGATAFVVLSPEDVKALRQGKVGPDPRFKAGDPMHWMERKTAIRQLVKLLPKSTTLAAAAEADERTGTDLRRNPVAEIEATQAPQIEANVTDWAEVEGEEVEGS